IYEISKNRYQKREWNYGKAPAYNKQASHKCPSGLLDVRVDADKGKIKNCTIISDFFGLGEGTDREERLLGINHERKAIEEAVENIDIPYYLGKITKEEFVNLIY